MIKITGPETGHFFTLDVGGKWMNIEPITKRARPAVNGGTMERFKPGTAPEEARHLAMMAFQAVASGWPSLYMAQGGPVGLDGKPQLRLDVNAMIVAAADIAALMTQAVDERLVDDLGRVIPTGPPQMGEGISEENL